MFLASSQYKLTFDRSDICASMQILCRVLENHRLARITHLEVRQKTRRGEPGGRKLISSRRETRETPPRGGRVPGGPRGSSPPVRPPVAQQHVRTRPTAPAPRAQIVT